jgi:hypothetical protein
MPSLLGAIENRARRPYHRRTRRSGGTGRRAGLKIRWPQGRVGSTPSSGTNFKDYRRDAESAEIRTDRLVGLRLPGDVGVLIFAGRRQECRRY